MIWYIWYMIWYDIKWPVTNVNIYMYSLLFRPTSSQHTGNTSIGITSIKLSRFYMRPPNKQLPHVKIINVNGLYFIIQQWSCEHFNLLILLSCNFNNFNNFVTLTKYKVKTPWRWCRCIETCRSAYDIENIINIYVVHLLVWIINCTRCMVHTLKLWNIHVHSTAVCIWHENKKFKLYLHQIGWFSEFCIHTSHLPALDLQHTKIVL